MICSHLVKVETFFHKLFVDFSERMTITNFLYKATFFLNPTLNCLLNEFDSLGGNAAGENHLSGAKQRRRRGQCDSAPTSERRGTRPRK